MTVKAATATNTSLGVIHPCFHCGEESEGQEVFLEDKAFCCQGCKTVYEILNENDLCQFYEIDKNAGFSLKGKTKEEYAYLDEVEVVEKLVDFQDDQITKVSFLLPQIHCASCIWLLEHLYRLHPGINHSTVNFLKKEIHLSFQNEETSLRNVVEVLASIGYAPAIQLNALDESEKQTINRSFFYKLGIAGFAFGNIMLLSFPEYLGLDKSDDAFFFQLFGYLNILLAIPVLTYSGFDYIRSAWLGLKHRELNIDVPISLGILTLFLRSVFEILTHTGAGYLDSLSGLVFFLLIGKWFQQQTYHNISFDRDYKSYFPIAANLKTEQGVQSTSLHQLKPGQNILVKNQELIPADAILLKGDARIDYSFVTGESQPVSIPEGEKIFAGGRQIGQQIELSLIKKVSQSYLTQLWNDTAFEKAQETQASALANKVGKYFTTGILLIAFTTLLYWIPKDMPTAINAFTAVLIIACPCAVALAIPFIFGNVLRVLGKQKFYLKNTNVIEALEGINVTVFDKTGTLTNRHKNSVQFHGDQLKPAESQLILAMCKNSNHPASQAIAEYVENKNQDISWSHLEILDWEEHLGKGIQGVINGQKIKIGSPAFMAPLKLEELEKEAGVCIQIDGKFIGHFSIKQSLRQGMDAVFSFFKGLGERFLLSGDHDQEKGAFSSYFSEPEMNFRQSPRDKLDFVKSQQADGKKVLMLGDGLNDAGALKQSEVGIVITENTNNFTPASDAILAAEQFSQLPTFIQYAQRSVRLVYGAYGFAFIYNLIGLSFAVQGALSPVVAAILMPLSSISIVLFGLLSSNLLAHKMGIGKKPNTVYADPKFQQLET